MNEFEELVAVFRLEATEFLSELTEVLETQRIESSDLQAFVTASRIAHNLKGAAVTVGVHPIAERCHKIETELETLLARVELPNPHQLEAWLLETAEMRRILDEPNLIDTAFLANSLRARELRNEGIPKIASQVEPFPETRAIDSIVSIASEIASVHARLTERSHDLQSLVNERPVPPIDAELIPRRQSDIAELISKIQIESRDLERLVSDLKEAVRKVSPTTRAFPADGHQNSLDVPKSLEEVRKRILVVDDSLIVRTVEEQILKDANFDVITCGTGEEALILLEQQNCDLVICDVQMPNMDGYELTTRIRASTKFKRVPVVLVTSRSAPEDITRGAQVGADAYVMKSDIDTGKLLLSVRRLIH